MSQTGTTLLEYMRSNFPFTPTSDQSTLLRRLSVFVFSGKRFEVFLLKGYAGTGKTTAVSNLVMNLGRVGFKSVLLAPTGRAAKVISGYSKRPAHTIHRKIYFAMRRPDGAVVFTLQKNKHRNTVFIADEASMIADREFDYSRFESGSLLEDLLRYVYTGKGCKLILVGDTAQLPPVKLDLSPALDQQIFEQTYSMEVAACELTEVMRQHESSGILFNATRVRQMISGGGGTVEFSLSFPDVVRLQDPYEIQDAIHEAFGDGQDRAVLIVRSNKRANQYNQQIRMHILGQDDEISTGDRVMIVKNNYFWLEDSEHVGFIANGDIAEILEIFSQVELYGFRFLEVKMRLVDYESQPPFETILLLDTLHSEQASLSREESSQLYHRVSEDYSDEPDRLKRKQAIRNDKYLNALQVKFSHAMTCHKTQGGQWEQVFLEKPFLPDGEDISYLRWLYTAITRATRQLFLIGFPGEDFEA